MDLFFGTSSFERMRGNLPELPVINMFAEQEITEDGITLQSRPGLEDAGVELGAGPVKAMFSTDGVLSGYFFSISENKLYQDATELGVLDGDGHASLAGFEDLIFANQGKTVYAYNGITLTPIAMPGGFDVLSMCVGSSRLIVIDKGTGSFFWSDPLTSNVDALSFATAENAPDLLKECLYIGDTLILFGSDTVEFWPITTDADAPFQPLVGRTFQMGIRDTGCAVEFNGSFVWVTDRNQVCITAPENIMSYPGLEAKIEASETCSLWTFRLESTEFLAIRLDTETWVYSSRSQSWSQFESHGEDNFIPQCFTDGLFGSSIDGRLLQFSDDHSDFGDVLERRFRAGAAGNVASNRLDNIFIRTNPGQTPFVTGDYTNPVVDMRVSKDGGFTWSNWRSKNLGVQGEYRKRVQWTSLGFFSYPGVLCEFRVTDPVPFRVSKVAANEPYGGI